jgi:hypothetical protein
MASKYKTLNLFDGALKLPLKLTKADEAIGESDIHYGYEGKRLNMVYVKAKEGVKKVASSQDIEVVVPFSKIEKIIDDNGQIKSITRIYTTRIYTRTTGTTTRTTTRTTTTTRITTTTKGITTTN